MKENLSDSEWLRERYHEDGLTLEEIGELCGVTAQAVHYRMDKHGVETRSITSAIPAFSTRPDGYTELRSHKDGRAYHHRLLATLLVEDISELKGKDVHHRLDAPGIKPDYLSNLAVMTRREHQSEHDMDHAEIGRQAWTKD